MKTMEIIKLELVNLGRLKILKATLAKRFMFWEKTIVLHLYRVHPNTWVHTANGKQFKHKIVRIFDMFMETDLKEFTNGFKRNN